MFRHKKTTYDDTGSAEPVALPKDCDVVPDDLPAGVAHLVAEINYTDPLVGIHEEVGGSGKVYWNGADTHAHISDISSLLTQQLDI